jgi:hypothetical protein
MARNRSSGSTSALHVEDVVHVDATTWTYRRTEAL